METIGKLRIRRHGDGGPTVIVLHGGPGAAGSAEGLACGLSDAFTVIEPWQRGSSEDRPLTVARHIADLHEVVLTIHPDKKPALVGASWGAMLALAYAAGHPEKTGPIVLVGCGTFDKKSRGAGIRIREARIAQYIARHPQHQDDLDLSVNDRLIKWHEMTDSFEPMPSTSQAVTEPLDMKAHAESWEDMLHCQEIGLYPEAFSVIETPVIMMHGAYDPHPGKMIRDNLKTFIPQLEYCEFEACGHDPAIERLAKDAFFAAMRAWLVEKCG